MKTITSTIVLLAAACLCAAQAASPDGASTISDDVLAYFKGAYNPPHHNLGLRDGRYFPYQTPFGGRRIGYRSVVRDKALYRTGLTKEEAEALLRDDLNRLEGELRAHVKAKYPDNAFDQLPRESREILLDFAYSEGSTADVKDEVYRAVIERDWQRFIHDMIYVRSKNGSPDNTLNRAFADRWIYSNRLIPERKPAKNAKK